MIEHFKEERFKNRPLDSEIKEIVDGLLGDSYADGGDRWAGFTHAFNLSYLIEIYNDTNAYLDVTIYMEDLDEDDPKEVAAYVRGFIDGIHPGSLYNDIKVTADQISLKFDWSWNE